MLRACVLRTCSLNILEGAATCLFICFKYAEQWIYATAMHCACAHTHTHADTDANDCTAVVGVRWQAAYTIIDPHISSARASRQCSRQASKPASERTGSSNSSRSASNNQPTNQIVFYFSYMQYDLWNIIIRALFFILFREPQLALEYSTAIFFWYYLFFYALFFRLLNNIYIYVCAVDTLARNRRALHIDYDYNFELFFCFASLLPCAVRVQVQDNRERWREDKKHKYICRAVDQRITIEMNYICMCTILSTFQPAFATNASPFRVSGVCVCSWYVSYVRASEPNEC